MRATILGWSALSGLVLGLMAGLTAFAVLVLGGELAAAVMPRMGTRARVIAAFITLVVVPIVGATLGWLEGRLKLQ
jgi:hypothetical protein